MSASSLILPCLGVLLFLAPDDTPRPEGKEEYVRRLEREKAELIQKVLKHEEERLVINEQQHTLRTYAEEARKVKHAPNNTPY